MPVGSEYSHPDLPKHVEQAKQMTKLLRDGQDSRWLRLRECLSERGIETTSSVLANFFLDGEYQEWGLIVTDDRRVFQFIYDWTPKPTRDVTLDEDGHITEWSDFTTRWKEQYFRIDVEAALLVAEGA
jgi:hypothetical protein